MIQQACIAGNGRLRTGGTIAPHDEGGISRHHELDKGQTVTGRPAGAQEKHDRHDEQERLDEEPDKAQMIVAETGLDFAQHQRADNPETFRHTWPVSGEGGAHGLRS